MFMVLPIYAEYIAIQCVYEYTKFNCILNYFIFPVYKSGDCMGYKALILSAYYIITH